MSFICCFFMYTKLQSVLPMALKNMSNLWAFICWANIGSCSGIDVLLRNFLINEKKNGERVADITEYYARIPMFIIIICYEEVKC